jgi:thiopeptide-type bacteriocin biosynthesis protein
MAGDLLLDTYRPESARFGGGPETMARAEAVFAADSAAVCEQLTISHRRRDLSPVALTAASLVDLTAAMCGSPADGAAWLVRRADLAAGARRTDSDAQRQAQWIGAARSQDTPFDEPALSAAWAARWEVVRRYGAALTDGGRSPVPDSVLVSLLHLHHVRVHGIDPDGEAVTHRLARAVALSAKARAASTAATA